MRIEILNLIVDQLYDRLNGTKRHRHTKALRIKNRSHLNISLVMKTDFRPTKRVVGRVKNMIFEIYTNDHNPPHFHVTVDRYEAKFRIDNPEIIGGKVPLHMQTAILSWAREHQELLMVIWNESRPRIIQKSS